MLRTHRAGKGPGGCGGWGLGSTEQKGPRHTSRLWSQRVGDPTWELSRLPRPPVGGANALHSSPAPLIPESPFHLPLLISSASLLCPQDQRGQEGASEGIGPSPRARQTSLADWAGETLGMLPPDPSPQGSLQAWEPLPLLSHPSGALVLSVLQFFSAFQYPHVILVCLGVSPVSLGIEVPHQHLASTLVVGRHEL